MKYLSVCSGIEAATAAWHPLGWKAAAYSEIEKFPRAVLQHHYPDVPLHGDFTTIGADEYGPIDLLVGGTPCQSFSIAGLRGGLADDRGNLALEFLKLADRTRPRWVVWENVPGVFSSLSHDAPDYSPPDCDLDAGDGPEDGEEVVVEDCYDSDESHAFACFLAGLQELGYGAAYRVLDAQYAGVPQRRRRVFVVGYLGDWRRAAAVLFERHSLQGHPPPRRETGQGTAGSTGDGIARCATAGEAKRQDWETCTFIETEAAGIPCREGERAGILEPLLDQVIRARQVERETGEHWCDALSVAHSLRGEGFDASEDGTGRGTPLVPVPFDTTQITSAANYSAPKAGDPCHPLAAGAHAPCIAFSAKDHGADAMEDCSPTLRAGGHSKSHANAGVMPAVAFNTRQDPISGFAAQPIGAKDNGNGVMHGSAVRRLTPRECERLQGFPDDYTLIPWRGKPADECPDGPRYKALGNSMAVPVMSFIGQRIQQVEALASLTQIAA